MPTRVVARWDDWGLPQQLAIIRRYLIDKVKYVKPEAKDLGPVGSALGQCVQGNEDVSGYCTNGATNDSALCQNGNFNISGDCLNGNQNVKSPDCLPGMQAGLTCTVGDFVQQRRRIR